jgi:hypothetical protein
MSLDVFLASTAAIFIVAGLYLIASLALASIERKRED